MGQLVEAVEDERAAHDVAGEEPEPEHNGDPDTFRPRCSTAGQSPGTGSDNGNEAQTKERHDRTLVARAGQSIASSRHR